MSGVVARPSSNAARSDSRFDGFSAVVTGASRGIGYAIAVLLANLGARVAFVSRNADTISAAAAAAGENGIGIPRDITAPGAAGDIVQAAVGRFGRLDILVHCAGVITQEPLADADLVAFDDMYSVNVRGAYALTQAALPALKQSQGQVLFVNSSIIRATNLAGRGGFAATQYALKAVADSLRHEVNEHGIRVISLIPGSTATARQERLHALANKPYRPERLIQPLDVAMAACDAMAMPRTAETTDIYIRPMLKE